MNGRRVHLDSEATEYLENMIGELKSLHCKASGSELVSEIIKIFKYKYFDKNLKDFEKVFFDQRRFLSKALLSTNIEDVEKSLKKLLKMKTKKDR